MTLHKCLAMAAAATLLSLSPGCKKSSRTDGPGAMPAADDWQAPSPMTGAAPPSAAHGGGAAGDPHAGMDMGAGGAAGDPHAGMNMGGAAGDPHAGVDMGAGGDPHAGMPMGGGDPAMAAVQPPDPTRPIDESKFLKGSIVANEKTASLIKAGAIMFISVKPIDPTTGELIGNVIAVDRIDIAQLPAAFHLTERNAMAAGRDFSGAVLINARVDADGEARSKSPGDVEGTLRATIPSTGLTLTLDTVLR